ncbi:MAG: hypothetical protein HY738_17885 [Bacteroidia bacterium]|nr:hypothetical protein [Bacteroidia bacterium]
MIKEIHAKSILRKHKRIDSWFVSRYGMNIYRGCTHNCAYCDGRAEGYYVSGEFGQDVEVKINAIELLEKELAPSRKKSPFAKGFVMLGGGVSDGYQPIESKYQLITDTPELIEDSICKAKQAGIDFIIFSGMMLKEGRQKEYFYNVLNDYNPGLKYKYEAIYQPSKWGNAIEEYYSSITGIFFSLAKKYNMPVRIPLKLFKDILDENDLVVVLLDHIDYILKVKGEKSPYGFAAWSVSHLKSPVSELKNNLTSLKGVGKATERIILEILERGTCGYYEKLCCL